MQGAFLWQRVLKYNDRRNFHWHFIFTSALFEWIISEIRFNYYRNYVKDVTINTLTHILILYVYAYKYIMYIYFTGNINHMFSRYAEKDAGVVTKMNESEIMGSSYHTASL